MDFDPVTWARWIQFASLATLFGTSLFPFYALGRHRYGDAFWRVIRGAALIGIASGCLWLALSVADLSDSLFDAPMWRTYLFDTSFGFAWLVRLVLYAALLVLLPFKPERWAFAAAASLSALLLISQALLGHAVAVTGDLELVAIFSYATHVLAAGLWLGGLLPLLMVLRAPVHAFSPQDHVRILQRFSCAGYIAVLAIAGSAAVNVWLHVGDWQSLRATTYGWLLFDKLMLFAALVVLASINRTALVPQLITQPRDAARVMRLLIGNISAEILLGVGVLAVAAVLGTSPPP